MQIEGLALVTEKAPHGGYALKQINIVDGHAQMDIIAYRSSLPELNMVRHSMEENAFRELAWFAAPPQPIQQLPQPQAVQPPQPPQQPPEEHFEMPRAFSHPGMPEADQGLVDKIADRMGFKGNGRTNAVVAFAFCAAIALSMNLRGLVT